MAQPLNRLPSGLLSFFQIKSVGQNPDTYSEQLTPTVDLLNFYMTGIGARVAEAEQTAVVPTTLNTTIAPVVVPDNEIWLVRNVTVDYLVTTSGAGEQCVFHAILQNIASTEVTRLARSPALNNLGVWGAVSGAREVAIANFDVPLFVPGGAQFAASTTNFAGGAARYTALTKVLHYPVEK